MAGGVGLPPTSHIGWDREKSKGGSGLVGGLRIPVWTATGSEETQRIRTLGLSLRSGLGRRL